MDALSAAKIDKVQFVLTYKDGRTETKTVTLAPDAWRETEHGDFADISGGFTGKGQAFLWGLSSPEGTEAGFKLGFGVRKAKTATKSGKGGFTIS